LARSEIAAEKIEAYRKTDYRFGGGKAAVTLRIDQRSDGLARLYAVSGLSCAVFVTAFNPFGRAQSAEANAVAHLRLGNDLRGISSVMIEGAGTDPAGAWPEEKSYLALGVHLDIARSLGRCHQQDAVVWVGPDAVPKLILLR
jgi:hypothetical protein